MEVQAPVTAVTVYPDRARVTRQGQVDLEAGSHVLHINELPLSLSPDTVRAAARGTARARLLGVQVQQMFYEAAPSAEITQLEAQVEELQDGLRRLDQRMELIRQQKTQLGALAGHSQIFATAIAAGEMTVDSQMDLLESLRKHTESLDAELEEILVERRQVERRLQKAAKELEQRRSARSPQRYSALVEVEVLEPGELTVDLHYVVSSAGWKPLYDLRLLEAGEVTGLEVAYLAQVTQKSGENWDAVALALSTARPVLSGRLPELKPWFVSVLQPLPAPSASPSIERHMMMSKASADAEAIPTPKARSVRQVEAEVVTARVDSSGSAVTYHVPGRVSVPSDGAPHKVTAAHFSLPPQLDYVTSPKLVEAVYRRATVVNNSEYILLPGAANLFAGDEFLGSTSLELTAPQGEIELYLGVEDRIKVERELKRREVDKTMLGGKRRIHYGYEIRLENILPGPARLLVRDQLPVGRHEDIKVKLENAEPRPTQQDEMNLLEWEFTLVSREKKTLRFYFSVEYPQNMEVAGLP